MSAPAKACEAAQALLRGASQPLKQISNSYSFFIMKSTINIVAMKIVESLTNYV